MFTGLSAKEPAADAQLQAAPTPASTDTNSVADDSTDKVQKSLASTLVSSFQEKETPFLKIRWGGKIYVDAPLGNEPEGAAVSLRKAEVKLSRAFGKKFNLKLTANYDHGKFQAGDTYLVYSGWKTALVTLGIQDPPFSLESMSSSSATSLMEEALPVAALAENKSAGLNFLKRTPNHIANASLVFFAPNQDGIAEPGQAFVARYVYSPIKEYDRDHLHLGASLSYRMLHAGAPVHLRSRPEVATADDFYIDTGNISDGNDILRFGLEASRVKGRFSWQTEVLSTRLTRYDSDGNDADTLKFWGAYFHISQFLTDDSRNYDQGSGEFIPLSPSSPLGKGGWGAFELAFRASYADLTSRDIIGGRESNLSLGLNWYLNDKIRFMANVIKVLDVDHPGSEYDGLHPVIFALRAQWLIF